MKTRATAKVTRKKVPQLALVAWCAAMTAAACVLAPVACRGESERPPNLVLILADDQGYGDLGCFGSETIRTPNLDRMAREGARLTTFYAAAPICTPTRAALMTGCYATRVGLPTPLHVYDEIGLSPAETTLAEALRDTGYHTGLIGKWHLGHTPPHYPTRHGFDEYWGTPLGHMFDRPATGRWVGDTSDLFLDGERRIPYPDHGELTERITEQAVDFIQRNRERPFFLFVAHPMPHEPLVVSERFAGRSEGGLYGDVIECLDWSTGKLLTALREQGLDRQTLVVYTSDNGPKQGHGSAGPLRGFKHQPYEGGVRVPCVVWAPGRIPAGREVSRIATVMDLYPTFLSLAGAKPPEGQVLDGRDLSPLLFGETGASDNKIGKAAGGRRDEFFFFVRHGVLAGVRQGRWKLLRQAGQSPELFDLRADPSESENLADRHPERVQRMTRRLEAFRQHVEKSLRPPRGRYRDDRPQDAGEKAGVR